MTVDPDAGFAAPTKIDGDGGSLLLKLTLAYRVVVVLVNGTCFISC